MKKVLFVAALGLFLVAGCSDNKGTTDESANKMDSSSTMSSTETKEERNKQVTLESIKALTSGNVDAILKDAAPDIVDYGDGEMPAVKGIDSARASLNMWVSSVKDYKVDDEMAVADGDYVFVYGVWSGTFKNDFMKMKTAGKSFKVKDVDIFKFNDEGKIIEHRNVQSFNTLMSQLTSKQK